MVDFHVLEAGSLQHLGHVVASFLLDLFTLLQPWQKRRSVKRIFVLVNIQHIHLKTRKLAGAPKEFFLNGTEEDIGEARGTNVELISESAEQKQHDTMWQSAEISNIVSGPFIQLHQY